MKIFKKHLTREDQEIDDLKKEINHLRTQLDGAQKQIMMDTECIERIRNHGLNLEKQLAEEKEKREAVERQNGICTECNYCAWSEPDADKEERCLFCEQKQSLLTLEAEKERLRGALVKLQHAGGCYCESSFSMGDGSHPRHTEDCEFAMSALKQSSPSPTIATVRKMAEALKTCQNMEIHDRWDFFYNVKLVEEALSDAKKENLI